MNNIDLVFQKNTAAFWKGCILIQDEEHLNIREEKWKYKTNLIELLILSMKYISIA